MDGNNLENLRELVELYLQQTAKQVSQLTAAIAGHKAEEVKRIAHSCAGASSTCGMATISPLLRELERQGHEGLQPSAVQIAREVEREFQRIESFLADYMKALPQLRQLAGNQK